MTLAQKVPVTAALLVTTPQDIALLDVQKAKSMFEKVSIPIMGIIENMSGFQCPCCGTEPSIFKGKGIEALLHDTAMRLLGKIPLVPDICTHSDAGKPIVVAEPEGTYGQLFRQLAMSVAGTLAQQPRACRRPVGAVAIKD